MLKNYRNYLPLCGMVVTWLLLLVWFNNEYLAVHFSILPIFFVFINPIIFDLLCAWLNQRKFCGDEKYEHTSFAICLQLICFVGLFFADSEGMKIFTAYILYVFFVDFIVMFLFYNIAKKTQKATEEGAVCEETTMKKKSSPAEIILLVFMYILLAVVACVSGAYSLFVLIFDDFVGYYNGGILRWIFLIFVAAGVVLPVLKYRKYEKKWVLPLVLCISLIVIPIFNNGILKFIEDDFRIYSKEKWENYEYLRNYMIEDLEANYITRGRSQEYVKDLLGEPESASEHTESFYYTAGKSLFGTVQYCIRFEDGVVVDSWRINE